MTCVLALLAGVLVVAAGRPDSGMAAVPPPIVTSRTAGGGIGTVIWEKAPRADGYLHADTPAMIERIKRLGVNHYTYSMWQTPKDWDDFRHEAIGLTPVDPGLESPGSWRTVTAPPFTAGITIA